MAIVLSGSTGISRPLGSAGSPSDVNTSDATTGLYFPASNTVGISTAGTNALYIDASQNVGIGTTSVIRTAKFSLVGGAASLPSINLGSSTSNVYIYEGATNIISFRTGAAGSDRYFSFDTSGNGNALNGSWVNGSDQRLKENVQPLSNGLASIMSLSPVQYNRIGQTNKEIGFIAQDLQKIVPEVVYDSGEYLGVSYGNMVALLTKALQELSAEVTALKAKVGA